MTFGAISKQLFFKNFSRFDVNALCSKIGELQGNATYDMPYKFVKEKYYVNNQVCIVEIKSCLCFTLTIILLCTFWEKYTH